MTKILVSAGEISGDMYAGKLIRAIHKKAPSIQFIGMGHSKMQEAGAKILADLSTASTIGFIEPLRFIPKILYTYFKMKKALKNEKPDLVIAIDYQGYHMVFIQAAKKLGIPVIYYISPQEWQWGTEEGGRKVIQFTDKILSIFPQEEVFYTRLGGNAVFIGHPIVDAIKTDTSKEVFYSENNISLDKRIVPLFPGSRPQELKHLLPVFLRAAKQLKQSFPDIEILVSVASKSYLSLIQKTIEEHNLQNQVKLFHGNQHALIKHSYLSIVSSGTVTLEHACLGTPFISNYRLGALSYTIAKKIVGEKFKQIKYISLPNIMAGKMIAPEFFQHDCTLENIVSEATSILNSESKHSRIKEDLFAIRDSLGTSNATDKAADEILSFIKN